jgi:hypothetical protein
MTTVPGDDKTLKFANRVSAELLELVERRCKEAGLLPAYAAFVINYSEGRLCARYGDSNLKKEEVWDLMRAEALKRVFLEGFRAEKQ